MTETITETLLALVPEYGSAMVGAVTFASCLALPVPASLVMLAGGAFAATGDLSLTVVASAALVGAVAGDQAGWLVGRSGSGLLRRVAASPARRQMLARARSRLERNDLVTVYLTRWLFSPLGPWVNLAAGATGLRWHRFTLGSIAGELTWVALYVGLGWAFAAQVDRLGSLMGNLTGFAAAAGVAALLARALWRRHH
jgi:membrane protein DedA with SNARE-associated domain